MESRTSLAATRPPPDLPAEHLGDHALERLRQHHPHLGLPVHRELVDDPVDGRGRRGGVQRPEDQVAGLRGLDCDGHRLEVPHLADHDDIGILPQRRPEGGLERLAVLAHLALGHDALLGRVHELDRILDREDVIGPGAVDQVHHRRPGWWTCREPVGPVTSTRPLVSEQSRWISGREPEFLRRAGSWTEITRKTPIGPRRSWAALQRKRATRGSRTPSRHRPSPGRWVWSRGGMMLISMCVQRLRLQHLPLLPDQLAVAPEDRLLARSGGAGRRRPAATVSRSSCSIWHARRTAVHRTRADGPRWRARPPSRPAGAGCGDGPDQHPRAVRLGDQLDRRPARRARCS